MANISERSTILMGKPFSLAGPELQAGDKAPDFSLMDSSLKSIKLADTGTGVRIFSVVPSLDTPVCDAQTKRFEDEAVSLPNINIFTVSTDLPFAQKRWCGTFGISRVAMLSDHKDTSFGKNYGTLISDMRIESRAIFVIDATNTIRYVEYVREVGSHPNYEAALKAAREVSAELATTQQS